VGAAWLSDEEVRVRLTQLDALLEQLEREPGPTAHAALQAVQALNEVFGAALSRVMALMSGSPALVSLAARDELLGHLLILHGLHPEPVEERVARALDEVRPYIASHGGGVELAGVDGGVARVRLSGSCQGCAASPATLEQAVTSAVLAAAPELTGVERADADRPEPPDASASGGNGTRKHSAQRSPPLIPAESLLRKPFPAAGEPPARRSGPAAAAGESPAAAPGLDGVLAGGSLAGAAPRADACELCGQALADSHRHLLDTEHASLLCACQACSVLFTRDEAAGGHLRAVPSRRVPVAGLSAAPLGVPVGLAFFVPEFGGGVAAHYPSPAGATRWQADPAAWQAIAREFPLLAGLAPGAEALLVNTARGTREAWVVPIDDCYRLVAIVRRHWQGMYGGEKVWEEIGRFFGELRAT
jgi:Fe-S cluster biogenesis protein NfuA